MQIATIAGTLGRDAEHKSTQGGTPLVSFAVAVNTGWGDNKSTTWWDVTKWGKGTDKLAEMLLKGTKVSVSGEVSTREHNGKTYLQIRADHVTLQGGRNERQGDGGNGGNSTGGGFTSGQRGGFADPVDDSLNDDVPFLTSDIRMERRAS